MHREHPSLLEQAGLASGLLTQEQIDRAWHAASELLRSGRRSLADLGDELLAEKLVETGALNRWQAEQLRHGRTKFTLGPYRIFDAIGHGGMGYVFKGEHSLLGRIEAIKVLPKSQSSPTSIAAFCREIRAQAQLDHPNLVRLSFADREGDTYYLVTEYVPGADLRRLIRHHGPLSDVQAAVIIAQAAEALAYAHQRGLIHRDVKPGNLLVTPAGHTKLTDLGLACFSSEANSDDARGRHIVGTPDFVAPEAIRSPGEVRPASDVYSLGCTLYYAVTGKVPYPGGKTADKLRRCLDETPIEAQRLNPYIDDAMAALIEEMMRKDPAARLPSASEAAARLRPWTEQAEDSTWSQIGLIAQAPGEPTYRGPKLADTVPDHIEGMETPDDSDGHLSASPNEAALPGPSLAPPSPSQGLIRKPPIAPQSGTLLPGDPPPADATPKVDPLLMAMAAAMLGLAVLALAIALL